MAMQQFTFLNIKLAKGGFEAFMNIHSKLVYPTVTEIQTFESSQLESLNYLHEFLFPSF